MICGFSCVGHDVSYALYEDNGTLIEHVESERISRVKREEGHPLEFFVNRRPEVLKDVHTALFTQSYKSAHRLRREAYEKLNPNIRQVFGHHLAHAANAFYSSPFHKATIITLDGGGVDGTLTGRRPWKTFGVFRGEDTCLTCLKLETHSNIGRTWTRFTDELFGLSVRAPGGSQQGSVMAMAAYGDPDRFIHYFDPLELFKHKIPNFPKLQEIHQKEGEQTGFDIAATLQKITEIRVRQLLDENIELDNVCLAGGIMLNSVMTGKMLDWYPNKKFYIPPAPYDAGLAMGVVQYWLHHHQGYPRVYNGNFSPYLGGKYNEKDVMSEVSQYQKVTDERIIQLLNQQKIISVYGGRSESGRRALGNRSILADPRKVEARSKVNDKVKHRQWFRPFAPSVLREHVADWFEHDIDSPYMSFAIKVKKDKRDLVPAVVHADGTARLQTVTQQDNPWFYNLLKMWHKQTGIPMLLNTSFNDREPIVETPKDAINCFRNTNIDYLYFYDYGILVDK